MRSGVRRRRLWGWVLWMAGLFAVLGVAGWVWAAVSPTFFTADRWSVIDGGATNEIWQLYLGSGRFELMRTEQDYSDVGVLPNDGNWQHGMMTGAASFQRLWVLFASLENPATPGQPGVRSLTVLGMSIVHPVPFSGRPRATNTTVYWVVDFPLWQWSLLWGSLALLAWWRRRVWWRRMNPVAGMCTKCGYDLRASLERCPECGTVVEVSREGLQATKTAKGDTKGHVRETPT